MTSRQIELLKLDNKTSGKKGEFIMNWKHAPYIIILAFSIIIAIFRIFMIPEWDIPTHILLFVLQFFLLVGIWKMINQLAIYFDNRIPFSNKPARRIALQIASSIAIVAPVIIGISILARPYLPEFVDNKFIILIIILLLVVTALLNFVLFAYYFFNQWQTSVQEKARLQVRTAEIEKEKSMLQYHHLKNQVNPHFLFNTFTSLDGLIQTNPDLASDFVRHLSKVYRYVLAHKENEVVSLQTEVDFIQHYISLLTIRYKHVLTITMDISQSALEKGIVMVTLQMLIDNAIKHNSLQAETPLQVRIWDEDGYLHIHNNKQLRRQIETSNKQGLQQLKELYSYLAKQEIIVKETVDTFEINLPLL
ncbi:MAG: sensor histidine kinase [Chitinophagaceae bacterium]